MIKSLEIRNYALIDILSIQFDKGFTIITGETGAGKSIILGALSLLMGQRADTSVIRDNTQKCLVEAIFEISNYNIKQIFEINNIDYFDQTIIRREILPDGRSRAFINDIPVNLSTLKEISEFLIDIHSQHETLKLNTQQFQIQTIDIFAKNIQSLEKYQTLLKQYKNSELELNEFIQKAKKDKEDNDYFQYQYEQINNAKLELEEQAQLEAEQNQLLHTEEIKINLQKIYQALDNENLSALGLLKEATKSAHTIAQFFQQAQDFEQRIENAIIDLRDIAYDAQKIDETIVLDPQRLDYINERLDLIYSLQKKFNVATIKELLEIKEQLQEKLLKINSYDEKIKQMQIQIEQQRIELEEIASILHKNRTNVKNEFEQQVIQTTANLGMPDIQFNVEISQVEGFNIYGKDKIDFLFSANKSQTLQPISKTASGGELSRLMLAIKYIVSQSKELPTIIFDEIDTGISGEIASKMGSLLQKMSTQMQIINITHLPQIAAKGNSHLFVYKKNENNQTTTNIKQLTDIERVTEIAKMLSGEKITETSIENAKILMKK